MKPYIIRELKEDEILRAIKVFLTAFGRTFYDQLEEEKKVWLYLINENIARFLIALIDDRIIGAGGLFLYHDVASIGYMGVLPDYRSRGVGSALFKNLIQLSLNLDIKTIILYASKLGEPIYKKYGFQGSYYADMYFLPNQFPNINMKEKDLREINYLPDWVINLDSEAMGFNRAQYLKARLALGGKILVIENEGYALVSKILSQIRLGPLIANNLDAAILLIKKSILLGAENLIIPIHPNFQKKLFSILQLSKRGEPNLKMFFGQELSDRLEFLYAIGTYGKG
ncbi:MAG: GNAT family N-acetyltransferase [Promethearchaeota archaeon]